jgi:plastocyanin
MTGEPARIRLRAGFVAGAALLLVLAAISCGRVVRTPALHRVTIRSFLYDPPTLTILAGDAVLWVNRDIVPHTATDSLRAWDSGDIAPGDSARVVLAAAGHFQYACTYHPSMRANLTIRDR